MHKELPLRLQEILRKAEAVIGTIESTCDGYSAYSVEDMLRSAASVEEDREKRVRINHVLTELQKYYGSAPAAKRQGDALMIVTHTKAYAYMTLVPPLPGGRNVEIADVLARIAAAGIKHGIKHNVVEAAWERMAKKGGLVYNVKFAECTMPQTGELPQIVMQAPAFEKTPLFDLERPFEASLPATVSRVNAGQTIAQLRGGSPGEPGLNVLGEEIPAVGSALMPFRLGEGIKPAEERAQWAAAVAGTPVVDAARYDVVPFYVVNGDLASDEPVRFAGHVLVAGSVHGPVEIRCRDLYVAGVLECADVEATGDVYIQGRIVGKKQGAVRAGGGIWAHTISDAVVEAMGDVVVRDSIVYSEVSSNGRVIVTAKQGAIFGGAVSALKEIRAGKIGSDFASFTSTAVGKDVLSERRIKRAEEQIHALEQTLSKIDLIKKRLSEGGVKTQQLPAGQQDVYISLLQKEISAREELAALQRAKEKFDRAMKDFMTATVKVFDELNPPVKVQICSAVQEFTERLQNVTLVLDRQNRVLPMKEQQ